MNIFLKNPLLAWLGSLFLLLFFVSLILFLLDKRELMGVNVWLKPMKFALATWIYSWTVAYLLTLIPSAGKVQIITIIVAITMVIEIILITIQAGRGVISHYNTSSPLNMLIFNIMGIAITINTIAIGFLTYWFFTMPVPVATPLLLGIRLGLVMFVLFSMEGFVMAGMLRHTVGAPDGGKGLFFLNWSVNAGDLRIAHFLGLHALQVVPLVALCIVYFQPSENNAIIQVSVFSALYFLICVLAFIRAMMGKPLLSL